MKDKIDDKLDRAWSSSIREVGRCERCGSNFNLTPHHIIGRASHSLRWEKKNGICLCLSCHRFAHDFPEDFKKWLNIYKQDKNFYKNLESEGNKVCKLTLKEKSDSLKKLCLRNFQQ